MDKFIKQTKNYRQFCHVENQIEDCKLGLFQDASYAGELRDSLSSSGGLLCILGSHTFVPISWMCKKQSAVSHSSAESQLFRLTQVHQWMDHQLFNLGECVLETLSCQTAKGDFVIPSYSHSGNCVF